MITKNPMQLKAFIKKKAVENNISAQLVMQNYMLERLLIGIAVFLLLFWLQHTGVGFWTIGGMMSLLWSAAFGVLAYFISEHDPIWGWVVFGLAAVIMDSLHVNYPLSKANG